jgi:acetyltransferase-like isoleucine patch superfamily enzyme
MKNKVFFFIQAVLRYFPYKLGIQMRNWLYPPFFKHYGANVRIFDSVVIKFPNDIEIGDHVTINQFCYIVGKGGLHIGNYTMIGAGSKITTTSHEFHDISKPMAQQGISVLPIILEEDIWLGFNVVLVGGVQIGKGSIAAAGSVVLGKTYPPYSILGGVPASIIRSRLDK